MATSLSKGFADSLERMCIAAGDKCEKVVKLAALDLYGQVIQRSPVGNPDIWKANERQAYMRETYNLFAEAINADVGKGKGRVRRKSAKALRTDFANKSGKGYVGGRFKNNWQVGIGFVNTDTSRNPDSNGAAALAAFAPTLNSWKAGDTIYLTNSMPYAQRLEYGWSKQAPGGMVRLSVQNATQAFAKAAAQVRST